MSDPSLSRRIAAMASPGRVIVVMPAYNAANTLERCWNDIPKDYVAEVIVVDDCSKDDTERTSS